MSEERNSRPTFGWLRSLNIRAPSLTTCIIVYYVILVVFGLTHDATDPLNSLLSLLFFTHLFILMAPFAHGPAAILVIVGVPVAIALCAVRLTGWWRIGSIMSLIVGTHLFSLFSASTLD